MNKAHLAPQVECCSRSILLVDASERLHAVMKKLFLGPQKGVDES